MFSIPKVLVVLSCGILLCLGLSQAVHAADETKVIKGEVVRADYGGYILKDKEGTEVHVHMTKNTQIMGQFRKGDRVEAKVDSKNNALMIRLPLNLRFAFW
jgi:hypothetical protein